MKSVSQYEENQIAKNDTAAEKQKRRIANDYLPKAVDSIVNLLDNDQASLRLKFDAAKWLAEQVIGKPKELIETTTTSSDTELAVLLASTLRNVLDSQQHIKVIDASPSDSEPNTAG